MDNKKELLQPARFRLPLRLPFVESCFNKPKAIFLSREKFSAALGE